jgi:hypothetical protein
VSQGTTMVRRLIVGSVLATAIATPALAQSEPRTSTWYDGGSEFGGFITYKPSCPKSDESPATTYDEIKGNTGSPPKIIDQGDQVEVQTADGEGYFFFRTKEACERSMSQRLKEDKQQTEQQQKSLDPYR